MHDESQGQHYHSRILRLWREQAGDAAAWRYQLIDPRTGERVGFSSPEALAQYLAALTESQPPPQPPPPTGA